MSKNDVGSYFEQFDLEDFCAQLKARGLAATEENAIETVRFLATYLRDFFARSEGSLAADIDDMFIGPLNKIEKAVIEKLDKLSPGERA